MKYLNDVTIKGCVGKILKSKNFGEFKILKYNDSGNVEIRFLKTGYETVAQLGNIKSGKVKDPYAPSVCGVDLVDDDNIFTNWIIGRKFDSVFLTKHINNKTPNTIREMLISSAVSGDIEIID